MIALWLRGLGIRRSARLLGTAAGIAVAVALVASLGSFLTAAQASMTARAAQAVSVDWQVELSHGSDIQAALSTVAAAPGVKSALPVGYARTESFQSAAGGSTQSTGPGIVLGIPAGYAATFPRQIRTLAGPGTGVLIAQQTAANLHIRPGDSISIRLAGTAPQTVTVEGVVDLPQANSLFQKVGAPPQSQPAAPPDNIVLLPSGTFDTVTVALSASRPDLVATQIHVDRSGDLPPDPAEAFITVGGAARNLEVALAGSGTVGNNLGAALDAARSDAAYSTVLFLFLGLPGAVLAGILSISIAGTGTARRRREQALLRARGATAAQVAGVAVLEAALAGAAGGLAGLGAAALIGAAAFGSAAFGASTAGSVLWAAGAFTAGILISAAALLAPALRDYRTSTVAGARLQLGRTRTPWWLRTGLDLILLAAALLAFLGTTRTGYKLVLAPEGVPSISVDYWAFLGPALLWIGTGLLIRRVMDLLLRRRRATAAFIRPLAGNLAPTVAAGMDRQRTAISQAVLVLALAVAFAASTATFNATYQQQAEVDARLTNGADVAVTAAAGGSLDAGIMPAIAGTPGAESVEALQHRYAYVGADLQDLYGVNAATIAPAAALQDTYFQGGTAAEMMHRLAADPQGILVSAETATDFQLKIGDTLTLRLQDAATHQLTPVRFRYIGVVTEFPTAPKDSFLVANAGYIAQATHDGANSTILINTGGRNVSSVAAGITRKLGPTVTVTGIDTARSGVGSSLTAADLTGLTRLELSFALVLTLAAGGLLTALGLVERRRTFAIATVLGATKAQLRGFVLSEGAVTTAAGITAGAAAGWALSAMLIAVLSGVFDPPPAAPAIPGPYLALLLAASVAGILAADLIALRARRLPAVDALREP
jgi:putative ABC transport system permease protein